MPRKFFTDTDIEELHRKGVRSLQMDADIVLTDLAYEKAKRLGVQLISELDEPPAAPVRPYLSGQTQPKPASVPTTAASTETSHSQPDKESSIEARIRSAVLAKLGSQVDAQLLDNIIHRVVKATGLK